MNKPLTIVTESSLDRLYESLLRGDLEAIVYDHPVLLAKAHHAPQFRLSGKVFHPQYYAFAIYENHPYAQYASSPPSLPPSLPRSCVTCRIIRNGINVELLRLSESGFADQTHRKWFGTEMLSNDWLTDEHFSPFRLAAVIGAGLVVFGYGAVYAAVTIVDRINARTGRGGAVSMYNYLPEELGEDGDDMPSSTAINSIPLDEDSEEATRGRAIEEIENIQDQLETVLLRLKTK